MREIHDSFPPEPSKSMDSSWAHFSIQVIAWSIGDVSSSWIIAIWFHTRNLFKWNGKQKVEMG